MAEETNKRVSNACAVSLTLDKVSFFVIWALTFSGGLLWSKCKNWKKKKKKKNKTKIRCQQVIVWIA